MAWAKFISQLAPIAMPLIQKGIEVLGSKLSSGVQTLGQKASTVDESLGGFIQSSAKGIGENFTKYSKQAVANYGNKLMRSLNDGQDYPNQDSLQSEQIAYNRNQNRMVDENLEGESRPVAMSNQRVGSRLVKRRRR